jgi:hypothetical protein
MRASSKSRNDRDDFGALKDRSLPSQSSVAATTGQKETPAPLICSDNDLSRPSNNTEGGTAVAAEAAPCSSLRNNPSSQQPSSEQKNNHHHDSSPQRDGSSSLGALKDITNATDNNNKDNNHDGVDVSLDNFTNLPTDESTTSNEQRKRRFDKISSDGDNIPTKSCESGRENIPDSKKVHLDEEFDVSRPVPSNQLDEEEFNTLSKNLDFWLSEGAAAKREKEKINQMIAKGEATKKSQEKELKQVEEWLSGANLAAVLELSLMKDYIDSLDEDEVDTSGYIQRYSDCHADVVKQTSTNNSNNNNNTNPSPAHNFFG